MKHNKTKKIAFDALLLALLIICSQISIKVGYTTFTLQLLVVFIIGYVCNLKHSLSIITIYILIGLVGIPVFASFGGGFGYVVAPTFGFVYGFYPVLISTYIGRKLSKKYPNLSVLWLSIFTLLSLVLLYIVGYVHGYIVLNILNSKGLEPTYLFSLFILPYIPFDLAKAVLALLISNRVVYYFDKSALRIHFKNIDSTSTYLKRNYSTLDNLTFVSADYQESGHGRMNRKWVSNKNENLMFSFLVKDPELIEKYSSLSLASAVAVYKTLIKLNLKNVSIKWPNDVYVGDKKICGILLESISEEDIKCVVVGIGINLNSNFDGELKNIATSYYQETHKHISLKKVQRIIYKNINKVLKELKANNIDYLKLANEYNYLKNKTVYAEYLGNKVLVRVLKINQDNTLKVLLDGQEKDIFTGEITFHLS